jgi:hypothetical protein
MAAPRSISVIASDVHPPRSCVITKTMVCPNFVALGSLTMTVSKMANALEIQP